MQTSTQDRSAEFEAAVLDSFKFLETDYGFQRRSSRPRKYAQYIIYETDQLYVTLSYGSPEYEPGMVFGRRGIDGVPGSYDFSTGDLVQLDCCRTWVWNKEQGKSRLANWVAELARLLVSCGAQCLVGDPSVFAEMQTRRNKLLANWRRDEKLRSVRAQIESAWRAKDYKQVLGFYESIDERSKLDEKRIAYAKKHSLVD